MDSKKKYRDSGKMEVTWTLDCLFFFFSSRSGQWKEPADKKTLDHYSRGPFDSKGLHVQAPQIDKLQSIFLSGQSTTVSPAIVNFLY